MLIQDKLKSILEFFILIGSSPIFQFLVIYVVPFIVMLTAIVTILQTFRPVITLIKDKQDSNRNHKDFLQQPESYEDDILKSTKYYIKNIGNRTARRVKVFQGSKLLYGPVPLSPGSQISVKKDDFEKSHINVKYKKCIWSIFWRSESLAPERKNIFDLFRSFKISSSIRNPAGKKRLRKALKKITKMEWEAEEIEIYLFEKSDNECQIRFYSDTPLSIGIAEKLNFKSNYLDLLFELTEMFGESKTDHENQRGKWVVSKTALKNASNCGILNDFKDFSKNYELSSEQAYKSQNVEIDKNLSQISGDKMSIGAYHGSKGKIFYISFKDDLMTFMELSKAVRFKDNKGFISAPSRRDAIIMQKTGIFPADTLVFINEPGIFIGKSDHIDHIQRIPLTPKAIKNLYQAIKNFEKTSKPYKQVRENTRFNVFISYLFWTFKAPFSE